MWGPRNKAEQMKGKPMGNVPFSLDEWQDLLSRKVEEDPDSDDDP